jgi:hypothetical protein
LLLLHGGIPARNAATLLGTNFALRPLNSSPIARSMEAGSIASAAATHAPSIAKFAERTVPDFSASARESMA